MIKKNNSSFIFGTVSMLAAGTYYVNDSATLGLNQNANQSNLTKQNNTGVKKPKSLIDSLSSSFLGQRREVTFSDWINTPEAISQYEKWRNSQDGIKNLGEDFVKTPQFKAGLQRWAGNTKRPFKDFYKIAKKQTKYQQEYNNWKVGSSGKTFLKSHYINSADFSKEADDWIKNGPGAINAKTFFDMKNREAQYRDDYDAWRAKAANLAALETSWKKTKDYTDKKQAWLDLKNQKGNKNNWLSSSYVNSYYQNWKASSNYQSDVEKNWKTTADYTQKRNAWINVYPNKKTISQYQNDESLWINKFNEYKDSAAGNLEIENEIKKLNTYTSRKNTWSSQGKSAWINSEAVNNYYNAWRVTTAGRNALKPIWEATNDYTTKKEDWIKSSFTDKKGKDEWLQSAHSTPFYNAWKVTPNAQTLLKNEWMRNADGDYGRKKDAWIAANYTKRNKAFWSTTNDATTKYNTWLASAGNDALLKTNWETTTDYTNKKDTWIENNKIKRSKNVWLGLDAAKASYNAWRVTSGGRNVLKPLYEASSDYTTNRNTWLLDSSKFTTKTPKNQWFSRGATHAWSKYNNWKVSDDAKTVLSNVFHQQQSYKNALNTWLGSWGGKRDKQGWALYNGGDPNDPYKADNAFATWKNTRSKSTMVVEEGVKWEKEDDAGFQAAHAKWPGEKPPVKSLQVWAKSEEGTTSFNEWISTKAYLQTNHLRHIDNYWYDKYFDKAKEEWIKKGLKKVAIYNDENINRWKSKGINVTGSGALKGKGDFKTFPNPQDIENKYKYQNANGDLVNLKYYGPAYNLWNLNKNTEWTYSNYSYKFGHYIQSLKHWKANNRQVLKDHWNNQDWSSKSYQNELKNNWVNKNFEILRKSDWLKSGKALEKYNQWKGSTQGQEALKNYYKDTDKYQEKLQEWITANNKRKTRNEWDTSNHAKSSYETWKESDEGKKLLKTHWENQPDYTIKKNQWAAAGTYKRSFETWIQNQASTSAYDTWEQSNKEELKTAWRETDTGDNNFKDSVNDWFSASPPSGSYDTKEKWINNTKSDSYLLNVLKNDENKALIDQFETSDFYKKTKSENDIMLWLKSDYSPVEKWVLDSLMSDQKGTASDYSWKYTTYVKRRAPISINFSDGNGKEQSYWQKIQTNPGVFKASDTTTLKSVLYGFIKKYVESKIFTYEKMKGTYHLDTGRNIHYDAEDGAGKDNLKLLNKYKDNTSKLKEFWKKKIFRNNDDTNVGMLQETKAHLARIFKNYNNLNFDQDNTYQQSYENFLNSKNFYLQKFKQWLNQNQDDAKVTKMTNDIYYQFKEKLFNEKLKNDDVKAIEKFNLWLANKNNGKNIYKDSNDAKSKYANWDDASPITTTRNNYDSNYKYHLDYESWINNVGSNVGLNFYLRQDQATTDYNSWVDSANLLEYNTNQFSTDFGSWESDKSTKTIGNGFDFYLKNVASNSAFKVWVDKRGKEAYINSPSFWKDFHNHYYADSFQMNKLWQQDGRKLEEPSKGWKLLGYDRISKLSFNQNGKDIFLNKEKEYGKPYYNGWNDADMESQYEKGGYDVEDLKKWYQKSNGDPNLINLREYWNKYTNKYGSSAYYYNRDYVSKNPGTPDKSLIKFRKSDDYYDALKTWLNKIKADGNGKSNWFWFYIDDFRKHYESAYNNWKDPNGEVEYRKTDAYKNSLKAFCEANINDANDQRVKAYLNTAKSTTDYNTWVDLSGESSYKASQDYTNHLDAWSANNNDAFTEFSGSHSQTYYNSWNDPNPLKYNANDYKTRGTYQNDFTSWRNALAANRKSNGFNYYLTQTQSNTDYAAWIDPQGEIEYKGSGAQYTRDFNAWETKAKGIGVYGATGKSSVDYNGWIDPDGESPYKNTNQYLIDLDRWSSTKSNGLTTYASSSQSDATWATKLDAEFAKTTISQNLINSLKPTHNKNIYQNSRQFQSDYNLWEDPLLRTENKYLLTQNFKDSATAYYDTEVKKFNLYKTTDTSDNDYQNWLGVSFDEDDYLADVKKTQDLNLWASVFNNGKELYAQSKKPQDDLKAYNQERKRTSEKYKDSKTFEDNYVKFINTTGQTYFDTWFHTAGFGKVLYARWKDTKGVDPDETTYMGTQAYVDDLSIWSKNIINGRNAFEKSTLAKSLFARYKTQQEQ